ncbi:hypothetical protein [Methylocystis hirsuta]|uniref:Thiaminase-2/PQQC domain-containing protein n=1 Tax=Methylocystis hirsuta TaxID=369798 RepID=A0A3M9XJB2_9HYPH|nr:hypothetical protein [Methylocystis hirsuta]RNJ48034.1 hypothetical protein D1O30_19510 [Methylocystis hirsuta]
MIGLPPGLLMGGGMLRPSITCRRTGNRWSLAHSLWEVTFEADSFINPKQFEAFIQRRRPIAALDLNDTQLAGIARLLAAQGCLTYDPNRENYQPDEVNYIVGATLSSWYGSYYSHPFWGGLQACSLTPTQLFGWLLRTYHLSRSAGVTAARGALNSTTAAARAAFFKNMIEEFAHCDVYYMPCHSEFGLSAKEIKSLVPLVSSTAFDHQMSAIAEDSWLAHVIVAYFQEYTAAFRQGAFELYDRVAEHYKLGNFFDTWKHHVGYDVTQSHAEEFKRLLTDGQISRLELDSALAAAATTVTYLIGALDELALVDPQQSLQSFRRPQAIELLGGGKSLAEAAQVLIMSRQLLRDDRADKLQNVLSEVLGTTCLIPLLIRALSHAEYHNDVLCFGNAIEALMIADGTISKAGAITISAKAILNFLREKSSSALEFGWLLLLLLELRTSSNEKAAATAPFSNWSKDLIVSNERQLELLLLGERFLELCRESTSLWQKELPLDVLIDLETAAE